MTIEAETRLSWDPEVLDSQGPAAIALNYFTINWVHYFIFNPKMKLLCIHYSLRYVTIFRSPFFDKWDHLQFNQLF